MPDTIDVEHCLQQAQALGEDNDCAVRACAVAAQMDYVATRSLLESYGRQPGRATRPSQYHAALRSLGARLVRLEGPRFEFWDSYVPAHFRRDGSYVPGHFRLRRRYAGPGRDYQAKTVTTLARELTRGTYLVGVKGHVLCLRDGQVHDWAAGRRHRILSVIQVFWDGSLGEWIPPGS